MNVLSLCDGISCGQYALSKIGLKVDNYYSSEIDKYPIEVTQRNYPQTVQIGDIKGVKGADYAVSLLLGGTPCQDLSMAKSEAEGLEGSRSNLFWEYVRIKNEIEPKYFLYENVVPKDRNNIPIMSAALGVEPILINSDLFVPQNRPRLYWTNIPIAELPQRPNWNYQYYQYRRTYWRELKSGVCCCLTANMGTGGNNVPYILESGEKRVLTVNELEQLQGLPIDYTRGISNTQRKKAIGNGWTIDVVAHILKGIKEV